MQKVISINLNGNAYQLDESGYDALREYLARAERTLADNPDRAEIIADLEQAIAEKCRKFLGPNKSVVNASEVEQIVKEMGPVEPAADEQAGSGGEPSTGAKTTDTGTGATSRQLFRIMDGAMIAGVCNGLAAYFQVDVTVVRIAFVVAALLTKGLGIMAYVIMMFVVPEASTPEERAAAGGTPFNAKEVIDQAKKHYAEGTRQWRRHWRQQNRHWRRQAWAWRGWPGVPATGVAYAPPPTWLAVVLPLFGFVHLAIFLTAAAMMISLVNTGAIFYWPLPPDIPVWAGALMLFVAYQIVVSPVRAAYHWAWHPYTHAQQGWFAFWHAVVWMIGLFVVVWVAADHLPEIREFAHRAPQLFREFAYAMRDFFTR